MLGYGKWKPLYADNWLNSLKTHAYPTLGTMGIRSIRTTHIHSLLQPIWDEKAETVSRIRSRIEAVFNFDEGEEWYSEDNPALWDGKLEPLLIESRKEGQDCPEADEGSKWLLLANRESLAGQTQRDRLKELLEANQALMTVYLLRDDLKRLWGYTREGWP